MPKIIPITDLRNTNEISKACHESNEPIFVTKNGYNDLVVMSDSTYCKINHLEVKDEVIKKSKIEYDVQDSMLGFIKVAAVNFDCQICDVAHNVKLMKEKIDEAYKKGAKIIVFPELSITSYSCGDMFLQWSLLKNVLKGITELKEYSKNYDCFITFGAPLIKNDNLYNCAVCISNGEILGVIPKNNIPEYNEFYEKRYFYEKMEENSTILINNEEVPFGTKILFQNTRCAHETIVVEICEDLWVNIPSSARASLQGATIACNLSASNETLHKEDYRRKLVEVHANKCKLGYIYCSASYQESTADVIFSGHNIIAEPDGIITESNLFDSSITISELDMDRILMSRVQNTSVKLQDQNYLVVPFTNHLEVPTITRKYKKLPFIDEDEVKSQYSVEKANLMQAKALQRRLSQIHCKNVVIGISGGLDSTIALLACVKCFDMMGLDRKGIHTITLPSFGTTSRTKDNATIMCEKLGVDFKVVNISKSVTQHLEDIDVSLEDRTTTFENAQARERTQVLMDYSNKINGIVIGTGDLSEIALGWSTYNGDHMSMYNLNSTLSKTFIKEMCYRLTKVFPEIKDQLLDILDTPISPELLPSEKDKISQKTEDIIGPYELHDFFLYHFVYHHLGLQKVFEIAKVTFKDDYDEETIKKWLKTFVRRFFNNQFKRSCCPDGAKISEVGLSPRGDFRMPSDASGSDLSLDIK